MKSSESATHPGPADAEALSPHLYVELFLHDGPEVIRELIGSLRARRDRVVREWQALYAHRFGAHRAIPDGLFRDTYGSQLRHAVNSIVVGDTAGFIRFAAELGEQVAAAGVPFGAMVSHLHLWKESCVKALADEAGGLYARVLLLDKLMCCFVSAAADGYYGDIGRAAAAGTRPTSTAALEPDGSVVPGTTFCGMVGQSFAMQRVFEQVRASAQAATPVLVLGETGVGKECIARAVHQCGPRRTGPFTAVNCAALPRELIESELFGYKRGAFSGAVADHLGLFRAASGGTLLLDEITEMSAELQAKLLRVLQERTVRPVGSLAEVPVDARIIASSNRDPADALASGRLRSDLYYRLCGSTIVVPPLRERADDIGRLVAHHIAVLNARYGRSRSTWRSIAPEAIAALCARTWPGNVRELFNVLEHAFTSTATPDIRIDDVAPRTCSFPRPTPVVVPTYQQGERSLIEAALLSTGGNKLLAARLLGISRKKLYARLAKYALPVLVFTQVAPASLLRSRPSVSVGATTGPHLTPKAPHSRLG